MKGRSLLHRTVDLWVGRYAEADPAALAAVAGLKPIVVVTGGSRGIGLALARRFAKAGHDVAIIARHADALQAAAASIAQEHDVAALAIPMNLTEADPGERIDAGLTGKGFYLDTLVNCAGVGLRGSLGQTNCLDVAVCSKIRIHMFVMGSPGVAELV